MWVQLSIHTDSEYVCIFCIYVYIPMEIDFSLGVCVSIRKQQPRPLEKLFLARSLWALIYVFPFQIYDFLIAQSLGFSLFSHCTFA